MGWFFLLMSLLAFIWWLKRPAARVDKPASRRTLSRGAHARGTGTTLANDSALRGESLRDGVSRYESMPQVLVRDVQAETKIGTSVGLPMQLTSFLIITKDEVFADLNRQATQARSDGNMGKAVALLQQAKQRQGVEYEDTRLALYLQHAGQFDESMAEFDELLARVDAQVDCSFGHSTPTVRKKFKAQRKAEIHDKARLAAKRGGRSDLEDHHGVLAKKFARESESLSAAADQSERKAYERKVAKRKTGRSGT